jgi:short-subunit dehydrogenase
MAECRYTPMKKAIVIGATSGIGRELATLLTENNYQVSNTKIIILIPIYRNSKRLK